MNTIFEKVVFPAMNTLSQLQTQKSLHQLPKKFKKIYIYCMCVRERGGDIICSENGSKCNTKLITLLKAMRQTMVALFAMS